MKALHRQGVPVTLGQAVDERGEVQVALVAGPQQGADVRVELGGKVGAAGWMMLVTRVF